MAGAERLTEGHGPGKRRPHPGSRLRRDPALPSGEGSGIGPASLRQAPGRLPADLVLLGEFGRAQGLRGEIRLKSYTGDPAAIAGYGPLVAQDGRAFVIRAHRRAAGAAPDILVVQVEGVADRDAAEALNRLRLHAPRERLGGTQEDEFFLADLVGLAVEDEDGAALGTVADVPNYGGGDLLEIAPAGGGPTLLLPFTKEFVPRVDLGGGRVVVSRPVEIDGEAGEPA